MPNRKLFQGIMLLLLCPANLLAFDLNSRECGKSVSIPLNETLNLTLAGNPTTGFLWELAAIDPEILAADKEPSYAANSSLTGAGGKFTFRFTPRKTGKTAVRLIYRRPWERNVTPLQGCELTVTVLDAEPRVTTAAYLSAEGQRLTASFDLKTDQVTVTTPDGRNVTLPAAPSASGARYSDSKETFWEHQGTARFFKGDELLFEGKISVSEQ